jgi:hypothetical protein
VGGFTFTVETAAGAADDPVLPAGHVDSILQTLASPSEERRKAS